MPQLGTLGAGNHYAEIQVVDAIYDRRAAAQMGIEETGQVCVMIHSGSRGLGHQVATDSLVEMEKAMGRDDILPNDRQLACARITSTEGQQYLKAMAAAANYAWVNRSAMTFLCRQAFAKQFDSTPDDLDMAVSSRSSTIVPEDASEVLRCHLILRCPQMSSDPQMSVI